MDQLELVAHAKQFDHDYQHQHLEYLPSTQNHIHRDQQHQQTSSHQQTHALDTIDVEKVHHLEHKPSACVRHTTDANHGAASSPRANDACLVGDNASGVVKDRGWGAWKFVVASSATEFMIWGASYGYGSFQDYHQHDARSPFHNASLTSTSSIGTTLLAGQHFIPLLSFGLYTVFPSLVKRFTYTCVVASSVSLLVASFANSVALLIVFQGLLLGIFGGNLFTTIILWLPNWWDERRGFATALIFVGSAIGGIVWPIMFTQLLDHVGFRWTLRTWSLIQLFVSGSAVICLAPGCSLDAIATPLRWSAIVPGFPRSLVSAITLLNCVALLTQTTAWYSVSLNISNYTSSMGFSNSTSTGILSIFNASAAITYFVLGYVVDRFPYALIMATSTILNLVFTVLVFGFAGKSLTKIIVYVVFFGISGGGFSSFLTPVSRDIADKSRSHEFSLRFLYLVAVRGLAAMLGPIVAVQFYPDRLGRQSAYGSYGFTPFIVFISGVLALSTGASLAIFVYKRYVEPRRERVKVVSEPVTPPSGSRSV